MEQAYGGNAELRKQRATTDVLRDRCEPSDREIEENWGVPYTACLDPGDLDSGRHPSKHLLSALAQLSAQLAEMS